MTQQAELIFPNLIITALPNSSFLLTITSILTDYENITSINFQQTLSFFSRPCQIGELYTSLETCDKCPANSYSIIDPMIKSKKTLMKCFPCDLHADCPGGSLIIPHADYWRRSNTTTQINDCLLPAVCILDNFNFSSNFTYIYISVCRLGHYGNLCNGCVRGYGKYQSNSLCTQCESYVIWNVVRTVLISIVVIIYLMYNVKILSIGENTGRLNNAMMKIIINHLQKLTLIEFKLHSTRFKQYFYLCKLL